MAKRVNRIYYFILSLILIFLCWTQFSFKSGRYRTMLNGNDFLPFNEGWSYEKNGVLTEISDLPATLSAPGQSEIVLTNTLPTYKTEDMVLSFITTHQEIKVFIDDHLVYELDASRDPLKKTPGNVWNRIELKDEYLGKEINVYFHPAYPDMFGEICDFRIGNRFDIIKAVSLRSLTSFLLCVFILFIGISDIYRGLTLKTKNGKNQRLVFLGLFAVIFAFLSVTERSLSILLFRDCFIFSYLPYIGQILIPFPILVFFRETFSGDKSRLINSALFLNLILGFFEIFLQISGIADFHESGILIQSLFIYAVIVVTIEATHSAKKNSISGFRRNWVYYASSGILIVTVLIDIFRAYTFDPADISFVTRIGLIIFLIALGYETERENLILMEAGMQSDSIKQIAYLDVLTGIRNRTAFKEDMASIAPADFPKFRIVMMDLNDLKNVNDSFGHSTGDLYIINSAHLIADAFSKYGLSYRLSGDEFCSILKNCNDTAYEECTENIRLESVKLSQSSNFYYMIASGATVFDPWHDKDLLNTMARADAIMYQNKKKMKKF